MVQPHRGGRDRAVGRQRSRTADPVAVAHARAPVLVEEVALLLEHALLDQELELGARVDAAQLELRLGLGRRRGWTQVYQVQVTSRFTRICRQKFFFLSLVSNLIYAVLNVLD